MASSGIQEFDDDIKKAPSSGSSKDDCLLSDHFTTVSVDSCAVLDEPAELKKSVLETCQNMCCREIQVETITDAKAGVIAFAHTEIVGKIKNSAGAKIDEVIEIPSQMGEKIVVCGSRESDEKGNYSYKEMQSDDADLRCVLKFGLVDDTALIQVGNGSGKQRGFSGLEKCSERAGSDWEDANQDLDRKKKRCQKRRGKGWKNDSNSDKKEKVVTHLAETEKVLGTITEACNDCERKDGKSLNVEEQKKKRIEVYCGLGSDVSGEYDGLVRGNHHAHVCFDCDPRQQFVKRKASNGTSGVMAMLSSTGSHLTTRYHSKFRKSVCLHDWWLIEADMDSKGRRLGVAGFASKERQGNSFYSSAVIARRNNTTTLESIDGINIAICGLINGLKTCENGFPSEVCNHFQFGFPYYWEEYAVQCSKRDVPFRTSSFKGFNMSSISGANTSFSINDLPVTRVRDLFMSTVGDSERCLLRNTIFNDILQKYGGNISKDAKPVHSDEEIDSRVMSTGSVQNGTPSSAKEMMVGQKYEDDRRGQKKTKVEDNLNKDDSCTSYTSTPTVEENQTLDSRVNMFKDVQCLSNSVSTRGMTRLNNLRRKKEEDPSSKDSRKGEVDCPVSASKTATGHQTRSAAIKKCAAKPVVGVREAPPEVVGRVSDKLNMKCDLLPIAPSSGQLVLRRSTRLKNLEKLS